MRILFLIATTVAACTQAIPGFAATFTVTYALADGNVRPLVDGAGVVFPNTDINNTSTATITVLNQGSGPAAVSGIYLTGAGFRLSGAPLLPATVAAGQNIQFSIVFAPTQPGSYTGSFRIDLPGNSISGSLTASTPSSSISLTYIDPDTNSVFPIAEGATVTFPQTTTSASSAITVVASNSGAGTGRMDSIAINSSSPVFQLLSLPSLPAWIQPAQQLRFGVRFNPQQQQAFNGTLAVTVNGRAITLNLNGQGVAPQFTYSYGTGPTTIAAGGTVALGDITVGQTTSVRISIANTGAADGQIPTIAVTGTGYSVSDLPSFPVTLKAGASQSFTLSFAPSQPGAANGRLTIGGDSFTITASGIGSHLIYSYTNAAPAVPVSEGGVVIFPPIAVGKSEKLQFAIQNTGTAAANITSINLAVSGASFALNQLPALPFSLDPGATATFGVTFTPAATGNLTANLLVNTATFVLSGGGAQPEPLSYYEFHTVTGSTQPAQQPSIGLTFSSPYPTAVDGTLKLTFASSVFTDDPAIQFATGGRSVNFTVPANSTQAMFNGKPAIALQTGTTAGSIVITPSFAMQSGFDLTPTTPDALTISIEPMAPQLLSASITAQTATSFTVVLNGYSTTRTLRQFDIQFTPKQGESLTPARITVDVTASAAAWFQSAASQTAGGAFLTAIPFVLGNGGSTDDLVHRLQSLSITATNEVGVSPAVTAPIQ